MKRPSTYPRPHKFKSIEDAQKYAEEMYRAMIQNDAGGEGTTATTTFLGLTDTPSSYADKAQNVPRVNSGETALEFVPLEDERIRFCYISDVSPSSEDGDDGDIWLEY